MDREKLCKIKGFSKASYFYDYLIYLIVLIQEEKSAEIDIYRQNK